MMAPVAFSTSQSCFMLSISFVALYPHWLPTNDKKQMLTMIGMAVIWPSKVAMVKRCCNGRSSSELQNAMLSVFPYIFEAQEGNDHSQLPEARCIASGFSLTA